MNSLTIATKVVAAASFDGEAEDFIILDETQRHRRRIKMQSRGGKEFLLDLPEAQLLRHGDILLLSDGTAIEVRAMPERLLKIGGKNPQHLLSLAWQIGNRHLAAQLSQDHIFIRFDHVIAEMLTGLGATVVEIEAPFNPEGGAYSGHHHHE